MPPATYRHQPGVEGVDLSGPHGLGYEVQGTNDLVTPGWAVVTTTVAGNPVPTGDGVTEIVTLQITSPPSSPHFYRLLVSKGG